MVKVAKQVERSTGSGLKYQLSIFPFALTLESQGNFVYNTFTIGRMFCQSFWTFRWMVLTAPDPRQ